MSHQGSASDAAILKKVNQHLARMSLGASGRVAATISNGQVTLSGNIQYESQRRPAVKAASSVEGVRGVVDRLRVPPPTIYRQPSRAASPPGDSSPPGRNAAQGPLQQQIAIPKKRSPVLDNPEEHSAVSLTGTHVSANEPPVQKPPQPEQVKVDDSEARAGYANFCRVTGTPEELIIDFGVNSQPFGVPAQPIQVTQRIVTNLYTAKRLLHVLQMTVERHETTFGVIETDVQKRARRG